MKVIGLTGGVGCGKSTVAAVIKENFNAKVLIADDIGAKLMEPGKSCYYKIIEKFGNEVVCKDGTLDKALISSMVFKDKKKLEKLNGIIHPAVKAYIMNEIKTEIKSGMRAYVFIESAIILQAGYDDICDEYWYITASIENRRNRLKSSRGYTDEKIDALIRNQNKESEYKSKCSFIFENDGEKERIFSYLKLILV